VREAQADALMPAADHDASPLLGGKPPPPPPTTSSPPRRSASGRTGAPAPRAPPAPGADDGGDGWPAARGEAKALAALAAPLVASSVASYAVSIVQAVFVGRLGRRELSVAVLATSFFNVTGLSFLTGSLGALETLAAQAHGRGDAAAVCAALQRAVLLTGALAAAVAAAWTGIEALMVALGQDPGLAAAAARFLHLSTPALLLVSLAEALKRWLMVQGSVAPAAAAAAAAAVAAPFFCWLLVYRLRLGLDGAALAGVAAQATQLAVLLAAAARREAAARAAGAPPSWRGWSADALRGWGEYMRLALPSAAVVCLEWWAFEACVMLAGLLEDPDLNVAVMGLCLSLSALAYMIPLGLGVSSAASLVGQSKQKTTTHQPNQPTNQPTH
jgi:MATE family multidrug resistance protein